MPFLVYFGLSVDVNNCLEEVELRVSPQVSAWRNEINMTHIYLVNRLTDDVLTSAGDFNVGGGHVGDDGGGRLAALTVHPLGGGRGHPLILVFALHALSP